MRALQTLATEADNRRALRQRVRREDRSPRYNVAPTQPAHIEVSSGVYFFLDVFNIDQPQQSRSGIVVLLPNRTGHGLAAGNWHSTLTTCSNFSAGLAMSPALFLRRKPPVIIRVTHPNRHNLLMCGRYRLSRRKQMIEEHFDSPLPHEPS